MSLDETAEALGISALELVRRSASVHDTLENFQVRRMRPNWPVTHLFQRPSRAKDGGQRCDARATHCDKQKT